LEYILNQHLLVEAARWKNLKIRAFLETKSGGALPASRNDVKEVRGLMKKRGQRQ